MQYQEVEIGEREPVKCLNNGLWFGLADELRYAVLLSGHREFGEEPGVRVEIAVPPGPNDLAGAADKAIRDGSNYYTLTYTPSNRDWRGEFRKVQVKLAQKGYTLTYRSGYYAGNDATPASTATTDTVTDPSRPALNAAMEFGSPQPSDVILKVAVNPATGEPEKDRRKPQHPRP